MRQSPDMRGEVAEWLKAHAWKACLRETVTRVAPAYRGSVAGGFVTSFLLYVALDYLWYWNHRLLHSYTWIWNLPAVHHSAKQVDVFTTARNSIWSHFAEVYLWFISITAFLLSDPAWFIGFAVIGSMLNFWTHTRYTFARDSRAYRWLAMVFIFPQEHLWHHSTDHAATNFGTLFSFWDRLHGTHYAPEHLPESYGNECLVGAFRQLAFPVPSSSSWRRAPRVWGTRLWLSVRSTASALHSISIG